MISVLTDASQAFDLMPKALSRLDITLLNTTAIITNYEIMRKAFLSAIHTM